MGAENRRLPEPAHPFGGYATRDDARAWFYRGVHKGAVKMLVVLDTFSGGDSPEFLKPGEVYKPQDMLKVTGTFDLLKPFDVQFLALYGVPKCEPTS